MSNFKPPHLRKDFRIEFVLSKDEKALLDAYSKFKNISISKICRDSIFSYMNKSEFSAMPKTTHSTACGA